MVMRTIETEQRRLNRLEAAYATLDQQQKLLAALKAVASDMYPVVDDVANWEALMGLVASQLFQTIKLIWRLNARDWRALVECKDD